MSLRVVIVDDEEPARTRLRALLSELPSNTVVGEATTGRQALALLDKVETDVVLLDISMPGIDGLEVARHLSALERAPAVIFCTAHDVHAVEAFEARAVDYLMKPVRRERLEAALQRARQLQPDLARDLAAAVPLRAARTHLCARVRGNLKLVPVGDVSHFLAEDKYVTAYYPGGQLLLEDALKDLEAEFEDRFVRVHRSCLVALDRIVALNREPDGRVVVRLRDPDPPLEVSRRNLPALRQRMKHL